jgi:hypothetical protein
MNISLLREIAEEFNSVICNYQLINTEAFTADDLMHTDNIVINRSGNNKLAGLLLNNYFPQNSQPAYHHYTYVKALTSINQNQST